MKAREREGNRGKIFSLRIMYDIWEGREGSHFVVWFIRRDEGFYMNKFTFVIL